MKKILWLRTGGTFNCRKTASGLAPAEETDITVSVSGVSYDTESPFTIDSTDINPRHWQILAKKIYEARESCDGFVITHGTDTLEYSAAALSFMLNIEKPVILTGAMLPPHAPDSDAKTNLTQAFIAARDMNKGVFVAFAGKIINGVSCIKIHSSDKTAFVDTGLTCEYKSDVNFTPCEKVFLLKITPNMNGDIADFILEKGYKGVVCEGFGLGGIPRGLLERLGELVKRGVRVVIVSQCLYGGADLSFYAVHKKAEALGLEAWALTGSAALVRLMFELAD
jgi:L-asparaginase